jgi:predicted nucleotidyltransferase
MTIELPPHWKAQLASIFGQLAPDFEVWAYGSRVTGQHQPASDLDLVLIHPKDPERQHCDQWAALRSALMESNVPISVDVMDWASLPPAFKATIERQKVKLFEPVKTG